MADETRRSLGPLAWAALEALVADSHPDDDAPVAAATVRRLAVRLGVAKNTAHRALVVLREAGFLEPHQSRSTSGQFAAGAYRLSVAQSILCPIAELVAPSGPAQAVRSRAARRAPSPSRQLSLLPSV